MPEILYNNDKVEWPWEIKLDDGWIMGIDAEDKDEIMLSVFKPVGKKKNGEQPMEVVVEITMFDKEARSLLQALIDNMQLWPTEY